MAKKLEDKVFDNSRVDDRMIMIRCGLDDCQKDDSFDSLISVVRNLKENKIAVRGDFRGHVGNNPERYEDQHGGYVCGVRKKERKRVAALNMTVPEIHCSRRKI